MCLSRPGRVERIEGPRALVDRAGVMRWCNALMYPDLQAGDRVLLHAGIVVEILTEQDAREIETAFEELGALSQTDQGS